MSKEKSAKDRRFKFQQSVGFLLAKANQQVVFLCKEEFAASAITPSQFVALVFLDAGGACSLRVLSQRTQIDRGTIGGVIERLELKGLVARQPGAKDRRVHRLVLTRRGRKLQKELSDAADRVRARMLQTMSTEEYTELGRLLSRLVE